MNKAITIMIDDVLNNFTQMLGDMGIEYNPKLETICDQKFRDIFYTPEGELTPAAKKAMGGTLAKRDGIEFSQWLKENGWTIVLCTDRDIRMAYDITKKWLDEQGVRYDYLFTATTPAGLCVDMDITLMVYNLPNGDENHFNVVCFKLTAPDGQKRPFLLGDFQNFEEVKQCIQKKNC